jgi:egghead protein (zeste-white 4 protein)
VDRNDHGLHGSITEDAYFALAAWSKGVKFSWIDGFMYEQSPFTIYDFILQRRRWFGGLWLVCRDKTLKLRHRLTLLFMITTWALSTFAVLITAANSFVSTGSGITDTSICISIMSAITCWSYTLGFLKTYSLSDGLIRYIVLLYLQLVLQPIFALMEIAGVIAAILSPPVKGFHIVQKEGKNVANK